MAARNDKWETVKSREDVKRKKRGGPGETVLPAQEQANRAFAAIDRQALECTLLYVCCTLSTVVHAVSRA